MTSAGLLMVVWVRDGARWLRWVHYRHLQCLVLMLRLLFSVLASAERDHADNVYLIFARSDSGPEGDHLEDG